MQYNDILDRLQKYKNQKISQAEMAEALEISQSAISCATCTRVEPILKNFTKLS